MRTGYQYQSPLVVPSAGPGDSTSPEVRVFQLFINQSANPLEYSVNGIVGDPLQAPGACMLFDPTGAQYASALEVAFDNRQGGTVYFPLYPGIALDARPGYFKKFHLRTISLLNNSFASTPPAYIGKLVVSSSIIASVAGVSAAAPYYVRPAPIVWGTGNFNNQGTGTGNRWAAVGGGTGIFQFRCPVDLSTLTAQAGLLVSGLVSGLKYTIRNTGTGQIYVSNNGGLTNGADATSLDSVFPIANGVEEVFQQSIYPNSFANPTQTSTNLSLFVYSDNIAAGFSVSLEGTR